MRETWPGARDMVLILEGKDEITNDPDDRGGLTKWGISQRAHPDVDIVNLTEEDAVEIYKRKYWDSIRADELPYPLDVLAFDMSVNHGPGRAVRFLQSTVNGVLPLVKQEARPARLRVDGAIGAETMGRVMELHRCNPLATPLMARDMLLRRTRFYTRLIRVHSQRKYIYGWLRQRVVNLAVKVGVFSPDEAI